MLTDPRRAMTIAAAVAALAGSWLLLQWAAQEALFGSLGYALYAIDLVAILILLAGIAVALLFARFAQVKADLLAGRKVLGRWQVTEHEFGAFAPFAAEQDRADKRGALLLVTIFVVLIFGAFALFDPEVAPVMLAVGAAVILLMGGAYLLGGRIMQRQLGFRSGEVVVGRDGLLVNGVLHVWGVPLSWLVGARMDRGTMTIAYAHLVRYGVQQVDVLLPVPQTAETEAARVVAAIKAR